jgi:hypothetical protein
MRRREFLENTAALTSTVLIRDSDTDIESLSNLNSDARQAVDRCSGKLAEDYILCGSDNTDYIITETSNPEIQPETDVLGEKALYTKTRDLEHKYPDSLETELSEAEGEMAIYLADPVMLGLDPEGWKEEIESASEQIKQNRLELQNSVEEAVKTGLGESEVYAAGAAEALSMIYALETGLQDIEQETYQNVPHALVEETPTVKDGNFHDFTGNKDFSLNDVFRADYMISDDFFTNFVPHAVDYSNTGGEPGEKDIEALYAALIQESPGEGFNLLKNSASEPGDLDSVTEFLESKDGQQGEQRQQPIDIEIYGVPGIGPLKKGAKTAMQNFLGTFYPSSMYDIEMKEKVLDTPTRDSLDTIRWFEEEVPEDETDIRMLLENQHLNENRLVAGRAEFAELHKENKTATGVAYLPGETKIDLLQQDGRTPLIVERGDRRTTIDHELSHSMTSANHQAHIGADLHTFDTGSGEAIITTPIGSGYTGLVVEYPDFAEKHLDEETFENFQEELSGLDNPAEAEIYTVRTPSQETVRDFIRSNLEAQED